MRTSPLLLRCPCPYASENLRDLFVALITKIDTCVTDAHHLKELDDVAIVKANAAVPGGVSDGTRLVGPVDAETLLTQTDPAWADRVVISQVSPYRGGSRWGW